MNTHRILIVGLAVLVVATGAVMAAPTSTTADQTTAPDQSAHAADGHTQGPPTDMPSQVPSQVEQIHQTIQQFLDGALDNPLGQTLHDMLGQNGETHGQPEQPDEPTTTTTA